MTVSIICASYNYAHFIGETIKSAMLQDFPDWEMIVADDGSKDNSLDVIESYCRKDPRIKLICHPNNQNRGLKETLKLAASKANGEWLLFIESDDILLDCAISEKMKVIEQNPKLDMVFSDLKILGEKQVEDNFEKFFKERNELIKKDFKLEYMLDRNLVPTFSCVMIKKNVFESLDFNTPMPQILDWWLWAQVLSSCCCAYVDKKHSIWRMHQSSYISTVDETKMLNFKKELFSKIFAPSNLYAAKILFKLFVCCDTRFAKKYFSSLCRKIRSAALNLLNSVNKNKTNFYYYNI